MRGMRLASLVGLPRHVCLQNRVAQSKLFFRSGGMEMEQFGVQQSQYHIIHVTIYMRCWKRSLNVVPIIQEFLYSVDVTPGVQQTAVYMVYGMGGVYHEKKMYRREDSFLNCYKYVPGIRGTWY